MPEPDDDTPKPDTGKGDDPSKHQAEIEKWKALARKHEATAKENSAAASRLKSLEDADRSELEKATAKASDAEARALRAETELLRLTVAADKGLTPAQAKRLVGTTREDLEADADELLETFGSARGKPTEKDDESEKPTPRDRPRERLSGGGDPTEEPEETDPRKLAAMVPRR